MDMKRQRSDRAGQEGFVLVYMAAALTCLLLFTGVAVDTGRAYVVKAQLTKAVDGAALAAARNINGGNPRGEAAKIYRANFPVGYMGTTSSTDPVEAGFYQSQVNEASGVNVVTVTATAILPTTFMKLGNFDTVTVASTGEATRRMVDLSLVLDVSSSIGPAWSAVRDAARTFIGSFDASHDRLALSTFGNGARVINLMPSSRGFDKAGMVANVPATLPGGSTNMVEGLYRAWDEVKSVPAGSQSGLRIIVLFTDGASNSVPGFYDTPGVAKAMRTFDFPQNPGDTFGQTWNSPQITGFYDTETGTTFTSPTAGFNPTMVWNSTALPAGLPVAAQLLPVGNVSAHTHHRSPGIPTSFPLQTNALNVDGVPQNMARGLRNPNGAGRFPSQVWNINNAARNLVEIIANEARNDNGDYRIRIYTIGMGQLVRLDLGTRPETSESILMRIANDKRSTDFNAAQLEGKYFYAETAADVAPAFEGIQNQILRLTK
jgi:Flp pilus assembly protein TadG